VASKLPPPPGFLLRTGQRWRYELPAAAFIASGIALLLGGGRRMPALLSVAVASFVVMCLWARCPRCRAAVVWRVLRAGQFWKWMTAVLDLRQCPACGFDGSMTDSQQSGGATT
jgi:hypothetical protein